MALLKLTETPRPEVAPKTPHPQSLLARPMAALRARGWGRLEVPGAPLPNPAPSPFQRRDAFVPAGGAPRGEAGSGLPRPIPVPGLLLSLPPALGVPAIICRCPRGERGNLKAVIKDAESKLPVPLRQREQVLVHVLWGEGRDHGPWRGPHASFPPPPPQAQDSKDAGVQQSRPGARVGRRRGIRGSRVGRTAHALGVGPWEAATHLEGLPALVRGRCGGGGAILCAPVRTGPVSAPPFRPLQPRRPLARAPPHPGALPGSAR